jgi:ABC-type tungstate transport system substrate-binding protein/ABC-type polar amino acid transport system ATPase subunit
VDDLGAAFSTALGLVAAGDPALAAIVGLSLRVSVTAVALAALVGLPLGALLAVARFPGRRGVVVALNALMGLPPVVAGLLIYLLLSRSGPLGRFGLLFTPSAMVVAQAVLIAPILAALSRQVLEEMWEEYAEQLRSLGAGPRRAVPTLLWDGRFALLTVLLAGFGRASAEVGAVMVVGGNIEGFTRVMTTAIALETSKGDLPLALALGVVLMAIVLTVNALAQAARDTAARWAGGAADGPCARPTPACRSARRAFATRRTGCRSCADVSFALEAGPPALVIGPNGAGKSVLLRLLHGLLPRPRAPCGGRGRAGRRADAARRHGVPAAGDAAPLRAGERRLPAEARRAAAGGAARRARAALGRVGLEALADRPARRLSGGEQQRLALARASALNPEVLFLDEPSASLDPAATLAVERIVADIAAQGTKVVMTTQDLGQARRLAGEVLFLHRGRLLEHAPAAAFFAGPAAPEAAAFLRGELVW